MLVMGMFLTTLRPMQTPLIRLFALLLAAVFFNSCATITRGVHEKLKVESNPPGANIALSTGEKGVTPAVFVEKRRRDNFTVTVSKPGYESQTVTVVSKAGGTGVTAMAANAIVFGGIIGMGVDAGSGAYHSLYPNPVSITLKPAGSRARKSGSTATKPKPATPAPSSGAARSQ
jgi:PEGA domain-containing protein